MFNLLDDLKEEFKLNYLFIAHDLSVVEHVSDRIAVMYLGKIFEATKDTELYPKPLHPYTKALLSAIPVSVSPDGRKREEARFIYRQSFPVCAWILLDNRKRTWRLQICPSGVEDRA